MTGKQNVPCDRRRGTLFLYGAEAWNEEEFRHRVGEIQRRCPDWHIVMFMGRGSPPEAEARWRMACEMGIEVRSRPPERSGLDSVSSR